MKFIEFVAIHHFLIQMGNTPILLASRKGNEEILKVLIKKGADINAQDKVLTTSTTTTFATAAVTATTAIFVYSHDIFITATI